MSGRCGPLDLGRSADAVLRPLAADRGSRRALVGFAAATDAAVDGDGAPVTMTTVPYALWGSRGDDPMRVWTPAADR